MTIMKKLEGEMIPAVPVFKWEPDYCFTFENGNIFLNILTPI